MTGLVGCLVKGTPGGQFEVAERLMWFLNLIA